MKFDPWTFVGYLVALALVALGLLLILWGCLKARWDWAA